MYAIINIAGQQFKVEKDQQLFVHRLPNKEGDKITLDEVLFVENGDKIEVGAPAVSGASVTAKVIEHVKGDKVIVFKKKRRKGYQTRNGHRQQFTKIAIDGIKLGGAKKTTKAEEKPKAEPKAEKAEAKKAETKKAETKKVETKKAETKKSAPKKEETEVSENLVTRAEHRAEADHIEINIEKVLQSVGTALKADADDLKLINGIGPVFEEKLYEVGIYTYAQISKLKAADREELSALEGITRDKIEADEWVKQAKELLKDK